LVIEVHPPIKKAMQIRATDFTEFIFRLTFNVMSPRHRGEFEDDVV